MPHIREVFMQYGTLKRYNPGQLLVEKGQPATKSCYIDKGLARTFCINPDGDFITLFYIEENNMICSESILGDSLVNVSVQAITAVDLYIIPAEQFLQIWEQHGFTIKELIKPLIGRLTLLSDYICCAHFRENNKKVAYFLFSCYNRLGPIIPYTNEQVADITGINRVSANRILNSFSKEGILELGYKKIKILQVQRLSEVFDSIGYFLG